MKNSALVVSGLIMLLMSAGHFYRYYTETAVTFGTFSVPVMWSLPIGIVVAVLALWMFVAASKN